jgi:hypothetical protein
MTQKVKAFLTTIPDTKKACLTCGHDYVLDDLTVEGICTLCLWTLTVLEKAVWEELE